MKFEETSFDIFQKYSKIQEFIESFREMGEVFRILEVGGRDSWLKNILPHDDIYCLDNEPLDVSDFFLGDATEMDFKDDYFDFVVSTDVLEHIIDQKRTDFIKEHYRCSKIASIIISPMHGSYAPHEEENVNRNYYKLSNGQNYRWLKEHEEMGLPHADELEKKIDSISINYNIEYFGWLPLWNFYLNLSHYIVFFNWKYEEVYKSFNRANLFFNSNMKDFDRSKEIDQNYRMCIKMFKRDPIKKRSSDMYIEDLPFKLWSEFSHLIWDILSELQNEKGKEILDLQEKNKSYLNEIEKLDENMKSKEKVFSQINEEIQNYKQRLEQMTSDLKVMEYSMLSKNNEIETKNSELEETKIELDISKDENLKLQAQISQQQQYIQTLLGNEELYRNSTSWRMTRPLRYIGVCARQTRVLPKKIIKKLNNLANFSRAKKIYKLSDLLYLNLDKYETISFDMFDTLVYRKIDPPELVHKLTAEYIFNIAAKEGIYLTLEQILQKRYEAEWQIRNSYANLSFDYECNFNEIINLYLENVGGTIFSAKYSSEIRKFELEVELSVLYTNPEAVEVLTALKKLGKKLIIISDMYLEEQDLLKILDNCKLTSYFDGVYVSNTYNLSKGTGRLFHKMDELGLISKGSNIHIGDNYISDYVMPKKIGIDALWYYSKSNLKRRKKINTDLSKGDILNVIKKKLDDKSDYYKLGFETLGPAFTYYIDSLIRLIIEKKITNVFFLAREGYLFIQIYEKLKKIKKYSSSGLPEGTYMYISRLSSSLPSVYRFGLREIRMGLWKIAPKGLYSILTTFNLNPKQFEEYAKFYGFNNIKDPIYDPLNDIRLHNFIEDYRVQNLIEEQKKKEKIVLKAYLEQLDFFGRNKRAAFVDIGWSGTIQHNIGRAFLSEDDFPILHGYYFGRNYDYHLRYIYHRKLLFEPGFSYDFELMKSTSFITEFPQLFEQAATAPHGSTIGYSECTDGIVPILKTEGEDRSVEQKQSYIISEIQQGILDFVNEYAELSNITSMNPVELKEKSMLDLERFIRNPQKAEVEIFKKLNHSEDWGASGTIEIVSTTISWKSFLSKSRLKNHLSQAFWKQGSLVNSGLPFVLSLYNIWNKRRK